MVASVQNRRNNFKASHPAQCGTEPGFMTALARSHGLVVQVGLEGDAPYIENEACDRSALLSDSRWESAQRKQLRSPTAGHFGGSLGRRAGRPL